MHAHFYSHHNYLSYKQYVQHIHVHEYQLGVQSHFMFYSQMWFVYPANNNYDKPLFIRIICFNFQYIKKCYGNIKIIIKLIKSQINIILSQFYTIPPVILICNILQPQLCQLFLFGRGVHLYLQMLNVLHWDEKMGTHVQVNFQLQ